MTDVHHAFCDSYINFMCLIYLFFLLFCVKNTNFVKYYRKFPKYFDTQKICCNHSKIWTMWLYHRVMSPNDADGMANSVDPDQTDLGLHCLLRPVCPKT